MTLDSLRHRFSLRFVPLKGRKERTWVKCYEGRQVSGGYQVGELVSHTAG